jgi:hypothetical protein
VTDPKHANLAEALAAFQASPPKVAKDSQGNRGKYADLSDLTPVVLPSLAAHGMSWSTKPTFNEQGMFVLRYTLRHVSGESDTGDYPLCDPASAPQVIGSAVTYARRYSLLAVTGVAPGGDDDDGAHATTEHRAQTRPAQRPAQRPAPAQRQPSEAAEKPAAAAESNGHPAGQDTPEAARNALMAAAKSLGYTLPELGKAYHAAHKTSIAQETDAPKIRQFTADLREKAAKVDAEAKARASA